MGYLYFLRFFETFLRVITTAILYFLELPIYLSIYIYIELPIFIELPKYL